MNKNVKMILYLCFFLLALGVQAATYEFSSSLPSGLFNWELVGIGNDVNMELRITNTTYHEITVVVSAGTVFIPTKSNTQRMLVRKKVVYVIDSQMTVTKRISVLCMDICKNPPSSEDTDWSVRYDKEMYSFLDFIGELSNKLATEISSRGENYNINTEELGHTIERYAVWRYQGASQKDIDDFLEKYGKNSPSDMGAKLTQLADFVIQMYKERNQ